MKRNQKLLKTMVLLSRTLQEHKVDGYTGAAAMVTLGIIALSDQDHDKEEWMEWISATWDNADGLLKLASEFNAKRRRRAFKVISDPDPAA